MSSGLAKKVMNKEVKNLIGQILKASGRLTLLTKRPFTLDGHMVGSIGEAYAQEDYSVRLYPPSHQDHDGTWNGREVQVKATQRNSVELKGPSDLLLVLKINPDGSYKEIYNGDGNAPWQCLAHRKATPAGYIRISLKRLRALNTQVREEDKIPCRNSRNSLG